MAVTKTNDYSIATNADLGNVLNNVDLNRIGTDLTFLELDGSTVKVSVGSIIESQGSLYKVDTSAVTPTGTATAGAYLFFDDSVPGFVWSSTAGTYDAARGGIYNPSDQRQCKFRLISSNEWVVLLEDKSISEGTRNQDSSGGFLFWKVIDMGDWNMDTTQNLSVAHGLDAANIRVVFASIRNDAGTVYSIFPAVRPDPAVIARFGQTGLQNAWDATNINLNRLGGDDFDSTDYNSTSYNRGWITIGYVE